MPIEPGLTVDEVMQRWPATIRTFLDYGMRCVGCPIGQFHTITDACREHGVDRAAFLAALRAGRVNSVDQSFNPSLRPNSL